MAQILDARSPADTCPSITAASSNGATTSQLRRSVLGQTLVLGALATLVGAALGLAAGLGAVALIGRLRPDHFFGPAEVPWSAIALITVAGVLSSVIAALIPSRGLGKLDIVSVMRGQSLSPPLRKRVPMVDAALAGIGSQHRTSCAQRCSSLSSVVLEVSKARPL